MAATARRAALPLLLLVLLIAPPLVGGTPLASTETASGTSTATPSSSVTGTSSASQTGSATSTSTGTPSSSVTGTSSASQTGSASASSTGTPSPSGSADPSRTSTRTITRTQSATASAEETASATPTASVTATKSLQGGLSPSNTGSHAPTRTAARTPKVTRSSTGTPEPTFTAPRTRTPTRSSERTASATASQTRSGTATLSPGASASGTGTAAATTTKSPRIVPGGAVGVGVALPGCVAELLRTNVPLCVSLRCTLACITGAPIDRVFVNWTKSCEALFEDFDEPDTCNTVQTCPCSPPSQGGRRLQADEADRSGADYRWVATLPELRQGRTIWFNDAAATAPGRLLQAGGAGGASSRYLFGADLVEESQRVVHGRELVAGTGITEVALYIKVPGGSSPEAEQQQQQEAADIARKLERAQFKLDGESTTELQDRMNQAGFFNQFYDAVNGTSPSFLSESVGFTELSEFIPTPSPSVTPTATWSGYASPGKPCATDFVVDLVVVEVNFTTRVVIEQAVCDMRTLLGNSSGLVVAGSLEQALTRGAGLLEGPRTPYPYTLKVPRRHVHKVGHMAHEGRGAHHRLQLKGQSYAR